MNLTDWLMEADQHKRAIRRQRRWLIALLVLVSTSAICSVINVALMIGKG